MKMIKSVGIITLIAIISKVLGFGRDLLMAAYFGASTVTDAFFVASIIPVLLFAAVGMAITSGIAPIYAEAKEKSKKEASNIMSVLATLFITLSVFLTFVFYLVTPFMTKMIAPGFSIQQTELTNQLTMIMLPSFCFFVLAAIMTGILEYEKVFAPPAFIAIPQNLFVIITIIFLTKQYGIYGVAVATLLGSVSQFFILYPFIKKYQVLYVNFAFKTYQKQVFNTLKLFSPIIIASGAYQINAVVDRMVASRLPEGSVSALNYANKLMYLPLSILLLSLITVIFPSVVDSAVKRGGEFVQWVFKGISLITFAAIPIVVVMLVESRILVELAFKRGAFDETAATMTKQAFFFYTFGMVFMALKEYLNRCFVALKETKVTMRCSIFSVGLNIVLSIALAHFIGVGGIALATAIAMLFQTLLLFFSLSKHVLIEKTAKLTFKKSLGKLLILFGIVFMASRLSAFILPVTNPILHLGLVTMITFAIFTAFALLLKSQEILGLIAIIKRRKQT
ncbi:murein biosynthesis integral membrane protein MurJ [Neobacillus cucumis]|uniref:murein biosynthesis integral membrane protein MurJ n=1 Tax=Neobacillus cucumis TaxID=1740721 RepID=UPI0018DEFA32|nr:murein biosynthesis integral membrane protein MurJ [Neobacillus cucumis]MBI0577714.1 murein biosynthesis integral membrane protein MurJ [Neobacillus cucumis]